MPTADVIEFACPGCGKSCTLNIVTKGLRHLLPTCKVYEATKADGQTFIKMAKLASQPKDGKIVRVN